MRIDRRDFLRAAGWATAAAGCDALSVPESKPQEAPPPITPSDRFYIQSCCGTPEDLDPTSFRMTVASAAGEVGIDLATLRSLPGVSTREHTLECIGAGPSNLQISNAIWTGVGFRDALLELGVVIPDGAVEIVFRCVDGYHTAVPITDLDGLWLAFEMNGEPLSPAHGAPFRFLNPGRYGTKNPKWVESVEFVADHHVGFWEAMGWSDEAVYRPNALILSHAQYSVVGAGRVRFFGAAFAGLDRIARVEWTADDGATWQTADTAYASDAPHTWHLYSFDWDVAEPGEYRLAVRAMTESGARTAEDPDGTDRLAGYDGGMEIRVEVT